MGPNGYDGLTVRGPRTDPITPNDRFYIVTKNLIDPVVDRGLWRLEVTGLVERPLTYGFDELACLPSSSQIQTLECISNGIGGGLMSNAEWKGVPLATLLWSGRPRADARFVLMHAADGYLHQLSLARAMKPSSMVAYDMNGRPLPHRHGYPARVLVPGTYGEVNVKWVDRIEVLDRPVEGYYERQGWRPWVVTTTSRLDRPAGGPPISLSKEPAIAMNGVAYAGDRGISKVEVSTNGGRTWQEMNLDYAPDPSPGHCGAGSGAVGSRRDPQGPGGHRAVGVGVRGPQARRRGALANSPIPSANPTSARNPRSLAASSAEANTCRTSPRRKRPVTSGAGAEGPKAAASAVAISPTE